MRCLVRFNTDGRVLVRNIIASCPLYPRKRTSIGAARVSAYQGATQSLVTF